MARIALALAALVAAAASAAAGAAVLARPLGLGLAEDFVLYRWFGYSRSDSAVTAAQAIATALAVGLTAMFDWRRFALLHHVAQNLALMLASITATVLALEFGFRLVNGIPLLPIENHIARDQALLRTQTANDYHPDLGWVLKSGLSVNPDNPATSFTTGAHGIRMNESRERPLPQGAILAVGDSFTAGSEVGDRYTWPAQLENLLGEPVLNGAVGGWATDQIVLRAEELVPILNPRTVIVSFLADDILRAGYRVYGSANKPWFDIGGSGELVRYNDPVPLFTGKPSEVGFSALGYFHVATFVLDRVGLGTWLRRGDENVRNGNDPVAVSCKLLRRAHEKFRERGVRMIFMLQHGGDDRHDRTSQKPHADAVVACARAAGIETIDTWPPLLGEFRKGLKEYRRLFVMHDEGRLYGHMTPEGNALIARLVAERLGD